MLKKISVIIAGLFSIFLSQNILAASANTSANTKVVLAEQSLITGIKASSRVLISNSDIKEAIANNQPIETSVIASACMFTTHQNGDYDLTITAERQYINGKNFALYNSSLGKVDVSLWIVSAAEPQKLELKPNIKRPLKDHSDINSVGVNCRNQVKFNLRIDVPVLRKAKAGTYDFGFNASTSNYTGE